MRRFGRDAQRVAEDLDRSDVIVPVVVRAAFVAVARGSQQISAVTVGVGGPTHRAQPPGERAHHRVDVRVR
jgi:hypothetical protein